MATHFLLKRPAYIGGERLEAGHIFAGEAKDVPSGSMPCDADGKVAKDAKPVEHRKAPAVVESSKSDAFPAFGELVLEKLKALEARIEALEPKKK